MKTTQTPIPMVYPKHHKWQNQKSKRRPIKELFFLSVLLMVSTSLSGQAVRWAGLDTLTEVSGGISSVATTPDGQTVAVGAFDGGSNGVGVVHVYDFQDGQFVLRGSVENPAANQTFFAYRTSLAISANGQYIAVGAIDHIDEFYREAGMVIVYKWMGDTWQQFGSMLVELGENDFGRSLALSENGGVLLVGDSGYNEGDGAVYRYSYGYNGEEVDWVLEALLPGSDKEAFGYDLDMVPNNQVMIVGSPDYGGVGGDKNGKFSIYRWYDELGWGQPDTYFSESIGAGLGSSLSCSNNYREVVVGAPMHDGGKGFALLYKADYSSEELIPVDTLIRGTYEGENAGIAVDMSGDGQYIAVGAQGYQAPSEDSGRVGVFFSDEEKVEQIGQYITGEFRSFLGFAVAISDSGKTLTVPQLGTNGHTYVLTSGPLGDTDGDGISDEQESLDDDNCDFVYARQDMMPDEVWLDADCDNDGLTNGEETDEGSGTGTDPGKADTDGDGVVDGVEDTDQTDPLDPCSYVYTSVTVVRGEGWHEADCDSDGIPNAEEGDEHTDTDDDEVPDFIDMDSDNDGILDATEYKFEGGEDIDGDELPNHLDNDSDGDGCFDGVEASGEFTFEEIDSNGRLLGGVDVNGIPLAVTNNKQQPMGPGYVGQMITSEWWSDDLTSPECGGTVSGRFWFDDNANGIYDEGERGPESLSMYLMPVQDLGLLEPEEELEDYPHAEINSEDGSFMFEILPQGQYYITLAGGHEEDFMYMKFTIPNVEGNTLDHIDSDIVIEDQSSLFIQVEPGQNVEHFGLGIYIDEDDDYIPDVMDEEESLIDPQGFFYCTTTGEIVPGGSISVEGPGNVFIIEDGSTGFYQFLVDASGTYTMTVTPPAGFIVQADCAAHAGILDSDSSLYSLGSSDKEGSGLLIDATCAANPYYLQFELEPGDFILNNNIPLDCMVSCRRQINVRMDGNCQYELDVSQAYNGPAVPGLEVRVYDTNPANGNTIDCPGLYTYGIFNSAGVLICWGEILAEDKTAPVVEGHYEKPDDIESVYIHDLVNNPSSTDDSHPLYIGHVSFTDNCNECGCDVEPEFIDRVEYLDCPEDAEFSDEYDYAILYRKWTATDCEGNSFDTTQTFTFYRPALEDLNSFGTPATPFSNCNNIEIPDMDRCGFGTTTRQYQAVKNAGTDNESRSAICEQVINGVAHHDYWVKSPEDQASDCGDDVSINGVEFVEEVCDLIAVSSEDERFYATQDPDACDKTFRTYRVINWCEYEGEAQSAIVSRDWDWWNGTNPTYRSLVKIPTALSATTTVPVR